MFSTIPAIGSVVTMLVQKCISSDSAVTLVLYGFNTDYTTRLDVMTLFTEVTRFRTRKYSNWHSNNRLQVNTSDTLFFFLSFILFYFFFLFIPMFFFLKLDLFIRSPWRHAGNTGRPGPLLFLCWSLGWSSSCNRVCEHTGSSLLVEDKSQFIYLLGLNSLTSYLMG